jgi:hypothetical protein
MDGKWQYLWNIFYLKNLAQNLEPADEAANAMEEIEKLVKNAKTEIARIKKDAIEKMTDAKDKKKIVQREIQTIKTLEQKTMDKIKGISGKKII